MAWEKRGNRDYYYKKRRIGGRVVSEYVGSGALAELQALLDQEEKESRKYEQAKRLQAEELEAKIDQVDEYSRTLAKAALLLAGYHPHKGQWRKRRND
jgi:hypothetical protein